MNELPKQLVSNKLHFKPNDNDKETVVEFSQGIPGAFNLKQDGKNNYHEFVALSTKIRYAPIKVPSSGK
jgi:hypothetical protein